MNEPNIFYYCYSHDRPTGGQTIETTEKFYHAFKTIFLQLAQCLKVMHENGVIFSDLSPNNVIIQSDTLELKLIDFEGAFEAGEDNPILLYTPGFAFLDQMQGVASTSASDCFAIGAIMHFFLTPVNQLWMLRPRSRFNFVQNVTKDIGFPPAVAELIIGLIDKDPSKR